MRTCFWQTRCRRRNKWSWSSNAITGITDAYCDSLPLVVFTGQVATPGIGKDAFQEADLLSMTTPITKANYQVKHVDDIPRIVHEAFYLANTT